MNAVTSILPEQLPGIHVELEPTGLQPALSDLERMVQQNARRFSETVMRPGPRLVDALEELAGILHPER